MRLALLMVTVLILPLTPAAGANQASKSSGSHQTPAAKQGPTSAQLNTTHSPHGDLKIPCINCHTFSKADARKGTMAIQVR